MEIAFVSSNKVKAEIDIKKGGLVSQILAIFYDHRETFISTMLVGNNIVNVVYGIGIAWLLKETTPLEQWLNHNQALVLLVQTIISTAIVLVMSEFLPKTMFRINPNRSLRFFAVPLLFLYLLLYPISQFTSWLSAILMRLFGIKNEKKEIRLISVGELDDYLQENIDKSDSWATGDYILSDYVEGAWEIKDHPAYYTGAVQYRGKNASYFFSFTTGYTLLNTLDYNFRFSELDTLESTRSKREIDVPAMLATGINYRLAKRHNVMVDLTWRVWDDDIENIAGGWNMPEVTETQTDFMVSLGYQFDGSPLFYESYWNRINYRAGAWYRNWYIKDVFEVGGSIGGGFPLGRKGTTIDVAFQGGKRFSDAKSEWEEMFIGLRIGLTGIATWGQERR